MTDAQKSRENLFIVKHKGDLHTLGGWLKGRKFNIFTHGQDRFGHPMFGLIWDNNLGSLSSENRVDVGVVIIRKSYLIPAVAFDLLIEMTTETEFGKLWKKTQVRFWGDHIRSKTKKRTKK